MDSRFQGSPLEESSNLEVLGRFLVDEVTSFSSVGFGSKIQVFPKVWFLVKIKGIQVMDSS